MEPPVMTSREITVPAWTFGALRDELGTISDTHSSTTLLQKVGYRSGISASAVFKYLCGFFSCRGWGTLVVDSDHPGLGFLTSDDWAEAMTAEVDRNASCCFSTGFISGLLSEIAGSPVSVLEAKCRARGDRACEFAFGSEQVVRNLYGQLLIDADPTAT